MIVHLDSASRAALAQAYLDKLDAGTGPATLVFYTAPMPAAITIAITTQTALGTFTASDPAGSVSGGVLTLSAFATAICSAPGDVAWARLYDSDGVARGDYDVSDLAGTGAIRIEAVSVTAGRILRIISFVLTFGA